MRVDGSDADDANLLPFNCCYRRLVGRDEDDETVRLQADFADVASGLREQRAAAPTVTSSVHSALQLLSTAVRWLSQSLGATDEVNVDDVSALLSAIRTAHSALSRCADTARKCLRTVREAELVARGYRLGASTAGPASLLESGASLHVVKLRHAMQSAMLKLMEIIALLLQQLSTLVASDVAVLQIELRELIDALQQETAAREPSIQHLSRLGTKVNVVGMAALVNVVRFCAVRKDCCRVLVPHLRQLENWSLVHEGRLMDALRINGDWRIPRAVGAEDDLGLCKQDASVGALYSGLRTIGAKLVLLKEAIELESSTDEHVQNLKDQITKSIHMLAQDWEFACSQQANGGAHDSDAAVTATTTNVPPTKHESLKAGLLEIDVIGSGESDLTTNHARGSPNFDQLLEAYASQVDAASTASAPKLSREERIEQMRQKRAAEEAAMKEKRTVHVLMGELEDVLKARK